MKILILGGHGFIGSHTSAALKKLGHTIAVVDCYHTYFTFPDIEYFPVLSQRKQIANNDKTYVGKIEDAFFMNSVFEDYRPDRVIHLATYPNAKMVARNVSDATNNMISATAIVLDLCVQYQVERFVFSSSSMAYGDFNGNTPDENVSCNPNTLYGSYKHQGERMCQIWNREHGLEYVVMRPSALYGTRDMIVRVISQMTISALKTGTIQVQGPDNKLDFSWVDDVADAFALATVMPEASNHIFNCTKGYGRSIIEAANLVKDKLGKGQIITKPHDPFYPNRDTLNSDKIKNLLGWTPKVDIEQGIPMYVDWLLAQDYLDHYIQK
jgi:nucleoside-diphosphate-sugar epimerase